VIVLCIMANMHLENIVLGCTNILVALTTGHKINIESAVQSGAIATVQSVAQSYPSVLSMLDAVLRCLGNLMGGGDEYKAAICAECGDEVLNIIRRLPHEASTLKMALRCIGNLATDDHNILTIVRQQATQAIVNSMKYQIADTVFIQMAMEVIGNFASFEAPEDCEGDPDDIEASIYHIISEEGGAQGVVDSMRANLQNASLLVAGMDALGNLANDPASCDGIVQDGAVQLIVDIMQVGGRHRSQPAHPRARARARPRADAHTHARTPPPTHPAPSRAVARLERGAHRSHRAAARHPRRGGERPRGRHRVQLHAGAAAGHEGPRQARRLPAERRPGHGEHEQQRG